MSVAFHLLQDAPSAMKFTIVLLSIASLYVFTRLRSSPSHILAVTRTGLYTALIATFNHLKMQPVAALQPTKLRLDIPDDGKKG